jgi:anti-sigma-K factor RskA
VNGGARRAEARAWRLQKIRQSQEQCWRLVVLYRQITLIPESVMSDPRAADQSRRLNHQGTFARTAANTTATNTAAQNNNPVPMWTILWTWLAAVAAVVVILGVVLGYGRSDLERQSGEPAAAGAATELAPSAPLSTPRPDERAPAPAANDDQ